MRGNRRDVAGRDMGKRPGTIGRLEEHLLLSRCSVARAEKGPRISALSCGAILAAFLLDT